MAGMNGRSPENNADNEQWREDLDEEDEEDEEEGELKEEEYDTMLMLDRLESLEEEMLELGVTTLDDVRKRIRELHTTLGE